MQETIHSHDRSSGIVTTTVDMIDGHSLSTNGVSMRFTFNTSLQGLSTQHPLYQCQYHPTVFYFRHEIVSWDGGGDSWDYVGWFCCKKKSINSPGCATGSHQQSDLEITHENVDYVAIGDLENPTLKAEDDEQDEGEECDNQSVKYNQRGVCDFCYTFPCSCDDSTDYSFYERDLGKSTPYYYD
eukprot:TRINITY_DN3039_c0_g1_i2.p1 TRINITY_DN3039_c0_g1~~TRINITY_DN3039_c0_g1_i2.p1  ORF type:complete len:184 (-),score=32.88 TRINITY_DN3039_c0_g1_i2:75-626(-)